MATMKFTLASDDFAHGATIPQSCTCDGRDISPQLSWMHAPEGTGSFVLIVDDPDAPSGLFTHWVRFDIPAAASELPPGDKKTGVGGRNDFQHSGYGGPCPPPNDGDHRYFCRLYALDVETLNLPEGAPRSEVEQAMEGHVLDASELMGLYQRSTG